MGEAEGDSEDEMSESISELPSFAGGTPKVQRKKPAPEVCTGRGRGLTAYFGYYGNGSKG